MDLTAGIATGYDKGGTGVRVTGQWERRAGIWSDVLSPTRTLSGRLASLQVSIGTYRQGHIRETVSSEEAVFPRTRRRRGFHYQKGRRKLNEPRLPATDLWSFRGSKEGTSLVGALKNGF